MATQIISIGSVPQQAMGRDKLGRFIKGHPFGKRFNSEYNGGWQGRKHKEESIIKMSMAKKGKSNPHHSLMMRGKKHNIEWRKKMSQRMKGENHPNWQGGINSENDRLRKSLQYALWREAVMIRDNYTCQHCFKQGGSINVHHIKPFSKYPEFRFCIQNGVTLCITCHKNIHKKEIKWV